MAFCCLNLCFLIVPILSQFNDNCQWGGFSLQGAQGYEIQCLSGDYAYSYTPCMSYALCIGLRYQAVYFNRNNGQCEYYLAEWDDGATIPQYSRDNGTAQYTFYYGNGPQCQEGRIEFDIVWTCDPLAEPFSLPTTCAQISDCKHTMAIRSVYACVVPEAECIWNVDGNTLDLTSVQGFTLNKISDDDPQQIYSLSPCRNNIDCDGDFSMATISTISNCMQTIARWDEGLTEPKYSNNFGGQWQFVYTNGDGCDDGPGSVVAVFWNCNPLAGTGVITAAKETGTCSFEIHLDSNLACSTVQ